MFNKIEIKHLIISILILGFVFGFEDKQPKFVFSYWVINLLRIVIIVTISILLHELAHKLMAKRMDCNSEYRLWSIKRFGLRRTSKLPTTVLGFKLNKFYLGSILAIFLTIISKGKFMFAAIGSSIVNVDTVKRVGRKFTHLKESENALIALVGPLTNLFLAIVGSILNIRDLVIINSYLAIYNMLPIPDLDGSKILFSSVLMYIFSIVFFIISIALLHSGILVSLILAFFITSAITLIFFYYSNK